MIGHAKLKTGHRIIGMGYTVSHMPRATTVYRGGKFVSDQQTSATLSTMP